MPPLCASCGSVLDADLLCTRCGTRTQHHTLSRDKFPLTIRLYSGTTDELLWSRTVTLDEARDLAKVEIPGYAGTEHYPVRAEIEYADGATEIKGLS